MTASEPPTARAIAYLKLVILATGMFVISTNAFVLSGLLPDIAATLSVQPSDVSFTITIYAGIVAIAAPVIAIALPRLSRTALMSAGSVVFALGTLGTALSSDLGLFLASRVLAAIGAAALVPAATASAATILPAHQRGRALGIVTGGLTVASALGAPIGTALGGIGGWRLPFFLLAGIAAALAVAVVLVLRGQGWSPPIPFRRRFAPLTDRRIVLALVAVVGALAGFNTVYIFSSQITEPSTGGSASLLAGLLLAYGVAGVIGNALAGPLTDRLGNRTMLSVALGGEIVVLLALPLVEASYVATTVVFALWGVAATAAVVPLQHRLGSIDPTIQALTMAWYTTAMYTGLAAAPLIGAATLAAGGPVAVPIAAVVALVVAMVAFQLGYRPRRSDTAYSAP